MLGIIYRNYAANMVNPTITLRLYVTLVRPCLEYAAQVWNPHLTKDINNLEKVQKFALRICSKRYHDSYESLLDLLEIPTLRNRRLYVTLCTFYKIINELVYFPWFSIMPLPSSSIRHCHPHCFKTFARCNGLKYSFVLSAVHLWNNLPLEAVSSADLRAFKFRIYVSPLFLYS